MEPARGPGPPARLPEDRMTTRVGVVGVGAIGADHAARLAHEVPGACVTAVFDVDTARAAHVADRVGARAAATWRQLVEADDVDAVVVASPGHLHPEQAVACVAAGRPVLVEKPLATSAAQALTVLDAEVAAGRRLVQVGFMRRYDGAYLDVKRALDAGAAGTPLLAHAVHRNVSSPDFFSGVMSLTDSVVHEIDVFRWLLDAEVAAVTVVPVRANPDGPDGLRDPQVVVLHLDGGQVVTVESFLNARYGYDVRCEVVGSLGTVSLENPRTSVVRSAAGVAEPVPQTWQERFDPAYLAELRRWVQGVTQGRVDGPTAWDGYAASAVAEAAVTSYETGERVGVALVERPGLYA